MKVRERSSSRNHDRSVVFGHNRFEELAHGSGKKCKVELYSISATPRLLNISILCDARFSQPRGVD